MHCAAHSVFHLIIINRKRCCHQQDNLHPRDWDWSMPAIAIMPQSLSQSPLRSLSPRQQPNQCTAIATGMETTTTTTQTTAMHHPSSKDQASLHEQALDWGVHWRMDLKMNENHLVTPRPPPTTTRGDMARQAVYLRISPIHQVFRLVQ
jgi:hypothetical protein